MTYLLLMAAVLLGAAGLYRFFLSASPHQVKAALLAAAAAGIAVAALFLSVTGRLPAAIAILTALWPIAAAWLRSGTQRPDSTSKADISVKEALEILGLQEDAGPDDIKAAHIRLMKQAHPDRKGSDWMAKKINAAKDLLLKRHM